MSNQTENTPMIVQDLAPGQILRPTKNVLNTHPRRIEKNTKGKFVFRRLLQDGSTGEIMWCCIRSMKDWVRKHGAVLDGARSAPPFDTGHKGVQFYAKDSDGQWYYVNHAGTWQTCPPPV
jgi:hypothetical protein